MTTRGPDQTSVCDRINTDLNQKVFRTSLELFFQFYDFFLSTCSTNDEFALSLCLSWVKNVDVQAASCYTQAWTITEHTACAQRHSMSVLCDIASLQLLWQKGLSYGGIMTNYSIIHSCRFGNISWHPPLQGPVHAEHIVLHCWPGYWLHISFQSILHRWRLWPSIVKSWHMTGFCCRVWDTQAQLHRWDGQVLHLFRKLTQGAWRNHCFDRWGDGFHRLWERLTKRAAQRAEEIQVRFLFLLLQRGNTCSPVWPFFHCLAVVSDSLIHHSSLFITASWTDVKLINENNTFWSSEQQFAQILTGLDDISCHDSSSFQLCVPPPLYGNSVCPSPVAWLSRDTVEEQSHRSDLCGVWSVKIWRSSFICYYFPHQHPIIYSSGTCFLLFHGDCVLPSGHLLCSTWCTHI